jgi:hypothetical protein
MKMKDYAVFSANNIIFTVFWGCDLYKKQSFPNLKESFVGFGGELYQKRESFTLQK